LRDRIAILGAGRLGEALVRGFLESGWRNPADLTLTSRREERRNELAERYGTPVEADNAAAAAGASLVIVAVKPQDAAALLAEIGPALGPGHTLLSVAAALSTDWYESRLPEGVPVIRAMPNTPAIVREGIAAICAGAHADEAHLSLAEDALRHLGPVVRVAEPYMDVVTAVSGSGPAYFSLLVESMIEAGVLLGLSREISSQLVIQTMLGTAKLLRDEHMHPVALREAVTSPAGTTTRALRELEQAGVRAAFLNAIRAAHERSRELAGGDLP
jgi:pyrroline-5-carboxylate reductase